MRKLSFWIKERHNPQFDKPYYVAEGQLTKKASRAKESTSLYGYNRMLEYKTAEEYNKALEQFLNSGCIVHY
jgi:hypothetical protein